MRIHLSDDIYRVAYRVRSRYGKFSRSHRRINHQRLELRLLFYNTGRVQLRADCDLFSNEFNFDRMGRMLGNLIYLYQYAYTGI